VVGYGETVISIGSNNLDGTDTIEASSDVSDGNKLAKTGGFIGTIAAYAAGIILMLSGLYFLLSGNKNQKN
jgi:hypothetical protein